MKYLRRIRSRVRFDPRVVSPVDAQDAGIARVKDDGNYVGIFVTFSNAWVTTIVTIIMILIIIIIIILHSRVDSPSCTFENI